MPQVPKCEEAEIKQNKQNECVAPAPVYHLKPEVLQKAPSKPPAEEKPCKSVPAICIKDMPASRPVCKRLSKGERSEKFRSSASCCQWRESGKLRPVDVICYCDACIGFKSTQCSSPRMAELRASQRTASKSRLTKTI